ncbi:thiol-disulfide isomerase/thioredoxin [Gelidibacter algens]|uniref:Thiol-disulfide isomerase/thioredoxin n=1 Tax=Gelidibacter algens TaxID=49280 RepID=A0A1A7R1F2_9FLAO|nr:TlpA disulfide reductase family protein [Gelidibacter algens]OBX25348.1 thiol-disulfide oxidoreductase [Gelidibacter algens]RAJ25185.1 thiol-disulfide isomerase/thioredoxin [Gelidibacter algens]
MKISKSQRNNIIFLVIILIMVIPQTRQPIQILLQKGLAMFSPSVVDEENRILLTDYDWQLVDENGMAYNFNDAKGKVVFINFWATWCPPCIAEMPSMEKLYQDYKEDVVFLFVSNEKQEVISKFKEKNDYEFLVHAALTPNPELLETSSIPRTFVIDQQGNIVIDKSGAADWNSAKVRALLDHLLNLE